MTVQQIKLHISNIIANSNGPITADTIYLTLINQVYLGRTQETIRKYS